VPAQPADPGIVIGKALAEEVGAQVGDELLLISPYGGLKTPLGPAPRLRRFRVVGVFETKFYQYDTLYTYVSLAAAQDFGATDDRVDGVEARTRDIYTSGRVAAGVAARLEYPYFTRDWKDYFPAIFEMLRDNRSMMLFLLSAIMVMAAFLIVATLLMMIMEKSADISILKVQGASDDVIERIFAIEGALIGLAGSLLGVAAGIAVTERLPWIQRTIEAITGIDTLPASIYQISTLPSEVDPVQLAAIAAMAMVLSLGATLVPSRQGARLDPAQGLRDR
jgi:lipoprotein-releasing system permease protein